MPLFSTTYQPKPESRNLKARRYLVFVYGTLLSGFGNHRCLETPGTKFIAKGTIRAKLFTAHWGYPFITRSNNNLERVIGEVYEVDFKTLRENLDRLEGYEPRRREHNHYNRITVTVTTDSDKLSAFVYVYEKNQYVSADRIISGNWRQAYIDHNKPKSSRFFKEPIEDSAVTSFTTIPA